VFSNSWASKKWARSYDLNENSAYQNHVCMSMTNDDHVVLLSRTLDGQIYLSDNDQKFYWNRHADPQRNEPTTLINVSAGGVKKIHIAYTSNDVRPELTIDGTLWGICAVDPAKKPKEKWLFKFVKCDDNRYHWQKEESLSMPAHMVAAASDGSVVVLTNDGVYQKSDDESWKKLGTIKNPKQIAIANKNAIFVLSNKENILVWKNNAWIPLENAKPKGDIKHITVSPDGVVYCIDEKGKIFYFIKEQIWVEMPKISHAKQIAVGKNKKFCWTSKPYENAVMKNHLDLKSIIGGALGTGGSVAILGSGVLASAPLVPLGGASAVIGGVVLDAAGFAAASFRALTFVGSGSATVGAATGRLVMTAGADIALIPVGLAVGAAVALPLIIVGSGVGAALFGPALAILTRPCCNEIYVLKDTQEDVPDESAPEAATTPEV
jgi:hypothetical protein